MQINPAAFIKLNVADTCSIWNILSSTTLWRAALSAKCVFCCTGYVQYECMDKPRKNISLKESKLKDRLTHEQGKGHFHVYHLDIDDLLDVDILQERMNLGKGELSSIAFAKRTRQAFITDDQGARKLAATELHSSNVQTTPHLFGWLLYGCFLTDADKQYVIEEHESYDRPLKKYFEIMYLKALELRLIRVGT